MKEKLASDKEKQGHETCTKGLKVATFGRWELKPPTQHNYKILADCLCEQDIHVCTVTGLPVEGLLNHTTKDGKVQVVWARGG